MKHNIILIGFMGSGKTAVGEKLAVKLGYRFQDTDFSIEQREKETISHIFKFKGEEYFRNAETTLLSGLQTNLQHTVLSTGGGLPVREQNRSLLKELGYVVYLKASRDTIIKRLQGDTTRPLLQGEDLDQKVDRLLTLRAPIYEGTAHKIITTDGRTLEEIVELIMEAYLRHIY